VWRPRAGEVSRTLCPIESGYLSRAQRNLTLVLPPVFPHPTSTAFTHPARFRRAGAARAGVTPRLMARIDGASGATTGWIKAMLPGRVQFHPARRCPCWGWDFLVDEAIGDGAQRQPADGLARQRAEAVAWVSGRAWQRRRIPVCPCPPLRWSLAARSGRCACWRRWR
jgi:hypothetical protein